MPTFAELLRGHRDARALSQEELAGRARLTAKAVGALERGERRRPYPHTVRALSDALGLDERERAVLASAASPRRPERPGGTAERPAPARQVVLPSTPIIGRDEEIDAVVALLRRPVRRLVTLTGPGGNLRAAYGPGPGRRHPGRPAAGPTARGPRARPLAVRARGGGAVQR